MIQVNKLHKYYNKGKNNEIHVINDTTISLPKKGLVCILGESGSGKTTLLNTLGGLDDYASGELNIAGEQLTTYSPEKMDRIRTEHCAYVFQNYYLLSDHTVDYNIRLVLNMYDMTEEEKSKRIDYVLEAVDMLKYKKRQISQLSGGQQQRVAIARALAKTPKIIFADEPTGNLDEANTMRVMHILKKVAENCLVVMVTHETRLANAFANRIIRVENGKIISDNSSSQMGEYQYEDDSIIYLKEYKQGAFKNRNVTIEQYYDEKRETETANLPVTIRVIEENGRYYIEALSDASVTFVLPNSKKKIVDEERPNLIEDTEVDFEYDLESLECKRMPKLTLKEIFRVAFRNLSLLGKQQMFLIVSFVAMAVLFVLTISDILTLGAIDIQSIVHSDSREMVVTVEKNGGFDWDTFDVYFDEMFTDFLETTDMDHIKYNYDANLYLAYDGFEQIQDIEALLTGYSLCNLEELSEESLIAGRMPEKPTEIVVDTWVLENFIEKEPSLAQILPTPEDYIGRKLSIARKIWGVTIVGISDTGTPSVFVDKYIRFSITSRFANKVGSVEMLEGRDLQAGEILVSELYLQHLENLGYSTEEFALIDNVRYKIAGTFTENMGVDLLLSEESYDDLLQFLVKEDRGFVVITDDTEAVFEYFSSLPSSVTDNLQIFVSHPYGEEMVAFEEARSIKLDARLIITIAIFAISLLLLYFSMKSNAMKKIEDIMVYRLLGIQKSSILLIFAIESILLTLCTSVPAVLVTSAVLKFIVSIPSLELHMVYPWSAAFGIIVFLFVINTITGILPIIRLIRKPPAQLTS